MEFNRSTLLKNFRWQEPVLVAITSYLHVLVQFKWIPSSSEVKAKSAYYPSGCESIVSCPKTQHRQQNVPSQGSNLDRSIQSQAR